MHILSKTIISVETHKVFIPIVLLVQVSLVTVLMLQPSKNCPFWRWVENGSPSEYFMEIFGLKKAWCWMNLFSIDLLAQDEECTLSQACATNSRCLK